MNRIVVLGVAGFFALVGIALVGGENKAEAFGRRGCGGCGGYFNGGDCHHGGKHACFGGGCHGRKHAGACHGRKRCHGRDRCHGRKHRCDGCFGGGYPVMAGPGKGPIQGPVQGPMGPMGPEKGAVGPAGPIGPEKGGPIQGPIQGPAQAPLK